MTELDLLKSSMQNILDTFTGADGGLRFLDLRFVLENHAALLDSTQIASKETRNSARQLLQVVHRFSALIDATSRTTK